MSLLTGRLGVRTRETTESSASAAPPKHTWASTIRTRLVITDLVSVSLSVTLAIFGRFGLDPEVASAGSLNYVLVSVLLAAAWMAALSMTQSNVAAVLGIGGEEYRRVITATLTTFGALAVVSMLFQLEVARGYLAIALPVGLVTLLLSRRIMRSWLTRSRRQGKYSHLSLLVGQPAEVTHVADRIEQLPAAGYQLGGVILDARADDPQPHLEVMTGKGTRIPVTGSLDQIVDTVNRLEVDAVIVVGHIGSDRQFLKALGWQLEGTNASLVLASRLTDIAGPRIHWRPIDGLPLMRVELPQYSGVKHTIKRLMDVVISATALVLLSPILAVIALAIRAEDNGPVLYRQQRVGILGENFQMHKFRSMRVDADRLVAGLLSANEANGPLFKVKNDPRITRIGGFLRRFSLDELPQLWDVLRGRMSLVGPRPPLPREVEQYEDHMHRRLNVLPGITGLWQVSGRSDLSWAECVRLDLYYVENWSPAGDALILFKTLKVVVSKKGAY